jgi:hypothetical protein
VHPSPAVAALRWTVTAASLMALAAVAVWPARQGPAVTTQLALDPPPRVHERDSSARSTPRRAAGRRTARPVPSLIARATPSPTPVPAAAVLEETPRREAAVTPPPQPPETVVLTYYRALDAGRFDAAWTILTPAVRASFGSFERWRDGYATTLSSSPRDIEVARDGSVASIAHELVTEDRSSCGPVRRRFAVRWRLALTPGGWRAASLSGAKLAGPEPAEACTERHDAARAAGGR